MLSVFLHKSTFTKFENLFLDIPETISNMSFNGYYLLGMNCLAQAICSLDSLDCLATAYEPKSY